MIILDTNVLSELLRPSPEPRVMAWLDEQPRASLFTSAVTQGEILYGFRLIPEGQRRKRLWEAAVAIFVERWASRSALKIESANVGFFKGIEQVGSQILQQEESFTEE